MRASPNVPPLLSSSIISRLKPSEDQQDDHGHTQRTAEYGYEMDLHDHRCSRPAYENYADPTTPFVNNGHFGDAAYEQQQQQQMPSLAGILGTGLAVAAVAVFLLSADGPHQGTEYYDPEAAGMTRSPSTLGGIAYAINSIYASSSIQIALTLASYGWSCHFDCTDSPTRQLQLRFSVFELRSAPTFMPAPESVIRCGAVKHPS
ncbi:uncharacterized protein J7T54_006324 [Emericellopsis cladophorae]|uniref:Uncharacterized protein n=1 Tax=Emericellopsis cladophorae TaxID=2686198 RepID=A0A9P9YA83_9HYPO|nr:uncharacterized protein J7T54_006324 [Emericellopsis cladophorae]KAI6785985.1 hypothetical protein J7T54_006324 [Emericellopsis cladophorae]